MIFAPQSPRRERAADVKNERTKRAGQQARADRSENHRRLDTRERTAIEMRPVGETSDAMGHGRVPLAAVLPSLGRTSLMPKNDALKWATASVTLVTHQND